MKSKKFFTKFLISTVSNFFKMDKTKIVFFIVICLLSASITIQPLVSLFNIEPLWDTPFTPNLIGNFFLYSVALGSILFMPVQYLFEGLFKVIVSSNRFVDLLYLLISLLYAYTVACFLGVMLNRIKSRVSKTIVLATIISISFIGVYILFRDNTKVYSSKQELCYDFVQSYFKTVQKTDNASSSEDISRPENQRWDMAIDVETDFYNLCMLDLEREALKNYKSTIIEKYQK